MTENYYKNQCAPKKRWGVKTYLLLALALAFSMTGCSEKWTKEFIYNPGIFEWHSNQTSVSHGSIDHALEESDFFKVSEYIKSLELPSSYVTYTGQGNSEEAAKVDADEQAKKDIDQWLAKIKIEDIKALNLSPTTRFVWGVKGTDSEYVGKFEWNMAE